MLYTFSDPVQGQASALSAEIMLQSTIFAFRDVVATKNDTCQEVP